MQETTTLNALVMRRARDLIADYGWPDHTDVDQRDPVNKPGWISIYVRLDAANIVQLLPLLCTGDVPAELQRAMTKISPYAAPATSPRHGWWCSFLPAVVRFLLSAPCRHIRRRLFLTHSV